MDSSQLNSIAQFLTNVSFFSEVSEKSLRHLCQDLEIEQFNSRETVFHKGDQGDAMYVILEGMVKVHEKKHVFGYLKSGECFGEYALIDDQTRSASITTTERTKVLKINRNDFLSLMRTDGGLAQGILAEVIKRHRDLDRIQEELVRSKNILETTNAKMSGLINGAMDAIIMFNEKFRILLTNPSANELLQNDDVIQRNVLFFFDEMGAELIETMVNDAQGEKENSLNIFLPEIIKVIGSDGKETLNEGTISNYTSGDKSFYTLILRNLDERLKANEKIALLTSKTAYLEEEIQELTSSYGILAEDLSMVKVLNLIEQVAPTNATVLINGETGTGKELVARAIHKAGSRNDKPLIRVNCGAIPVNLIESELFGHEKGAFTGATNSRKGRFLLADKGTIFLDEIGELPLDLQPKLLRVLQEGEFDPLGSSETIKVDVRIIAATNRDLLTYAREKKFREDLYYRLNVFPVEVPPLRDRGNDICLIAQEMINQFSAKLGKNPTPLTEADKLILKGYHWPGNVRELQNLIERGVIVSTDSSPDWRQIIPGELNKQLQPTTLPEEVILTAEQIIKIEKENIIRALEKTNWRISGEKGAAKLLKLPPTTLASKIKAHQIKRT